MTAITGLRRRRVDLASCWSATGCECARLKRRTAVETGLQQPSATSIATVKPSYYCLPVTSSLATRRIALLRMRPPR